MNAFRIVSVNVSKEKGVPKTPVDFLNLIENFGAEGDGHAGPHHRQISLLAEEDIVAFAKKGVDVSIGTFAENITTQGVDLVALPVGSRLSAGEALLEVTQIGKTCHHGCEIMKKAGDCIMPRRGIFARVIRGGRVNREDSGAYGL